jgi:putative transposase
MQLNRQYGQQWNRKRIQRLMHLMGIRGIAPGPDTSKPHPEHRLYSYLLRGLAIERVNQVWSTDVTFIPMPKGFMYRVTVIDWYNRYVLVWALSNMQALHVRIVVDSQSE